MNRLERISEWRRRDGRRGFTLIELLVVILIILLVSAVVLPTVLPALSHRQASEAARILQGALVGARDAAINTNAPAGIRLLPDSVLNGISPNANPPYTTLPNQLDPSKILASNRYIPIQLAPDYAEGKVSVIQDTLASTSPFSQALPILLPYAGQAANPPGVALVAYPVVVLMVEQCPVYQDPTSGWLPNSPTSWYWNIRVGDRIQLAGASQTYVVVGPVCVSPNNSGAQGNPELFVNIGFPGSEVTNYVLNRTYPDGKTYQVDYLLLVNGKDDNNNGYVDDGWDGVDNNLPYEIAYNLPHLTDEPIEWENETWIGSLVNPPVLPPPFSSPGATPPINVSGLLNQSYIITRRPVVSPGARETPLPSNVVVDLTTWNPSAFGTQYFSERSRLPVDVNTGNVDILVYPNGTVLPSTVYSTPSSFSMNAAFYHFWLAERGDLFDPLPQPNVPYLLPMLAGSPHYPAAGDLFSTGTSSTRVLTGERRLMTLYTRTGQLVTNQIEAFDGANTNYPFQLPQQGLRGDTR